MYDSVYASMCLSLWQVESARGHPIGTQMGRAGWLTTLGLEAWDGPEGCPAERGLRLGTFKLDESTNSHLPANSVSFFNP